MVRSSASAKLLTPAEYKRLRAFAPHDVEIRCDVWREFLSRMLGRKLTLAQTPRIISEYNRLRREEHAA